MALGVSLSWARPTNARPLLHKDVIPYGCGGFGQNSFGTVHHVLCGCVLEVAVQHLMYNALDLRVASNARDCFYTYATLGNAATRYRDGSCLLLAHGELLSLCGFLLTTAIV